jgi:glycosyltransferase involved in cell wall biosynthesis
MWYVAQIGAREHYAVPRALCQRGELAGMFTDFWVPPGHVVGMVSGAVRLRDRYHPDLADVEVSASNMRFLAFEAVQRGRRRAGWPVIIHRNRLFQRMVIETLTARCEILRTLQIAQPMTIFAYSYAARDIFHWAKQRGWRTILGQIDPGPEEERIVQAEHKRYGHLSSKWQPAPEGYWGAWREELALADRVIVNSEWSRGCLRREGCPAEKLEVVPLVYAMAPSNGCPQPVRGERPGAPLRILFLGQINLRKGIGRLLDAMRLLRNEPFELILVGPSEIDSSAWADLPNVHWIGSVARSEVSQVYRSADVFILPTLSDGFALTQLEAQAHGLPVIASAHCGAVVVPGVNGWVLPDTEAATICKVLQYVRAHPQLKSAAVATDFGLIDLADRLTGYS